MESALDGRTRPPSMDAERHVLVLVRPLHDRDVVGVRGLREGANLFFARSASMPLEDDRVLAERIFERAYLGLASLRAHLTRSDDDDDERERGRQGEKGRSFASPVPEIGIVELDLGGPRATL
jgi:hypothetical protein